MAAALIDRLLHHCHIVNIRGNSYRMRKHAGVWKRPDGASSEQPPTHTSPPAPPRRRGSLRAREVVTN